MADENIDLRFLAEQGKQILAELAEARVERKAMREEFAGMRSDISDLQHEVSAMRVDQRRTNEVLEKVHETQQNHGARLNAIDGRLALIEKHTGLVKA
jgi:chromosome segregation ATPase